MPEPDTHIVAAGRMQDIGAPVVRWDQRGGYDCPNRRGRRACTQHDPKLNGAPTRANSAYKIKDPEKAYQELKKSVYQLILHYDVCYTSNHCHRVLKNSSFMGSHFYLDLDGTLYQTCDLYWKTNTAPADDKKGNERSVHVEIANLSWQALAAESDLFKLQKDAYRLKREQWCLALPEKHQKTLRTPGFVAKASRPYGSRGYFSRRINGHTVRMWDFTEEQYQTVLKLCVGIHRLLPGIQLKVPFDEEKHRTPLGRITGFSRYKGVLGHAHVQGGTTDGKVKRKYDPGSAFNWGRLRRHLERERNKKT